MYNYVVLFESVDDGKGFIDILQVSAEQNRIKILCLLADAYSNPKKICSCPDCDCPLVGGMCVCEITTLLAKPQALVSHHLSMLKRVQIVVTKRVGKKIYYLLNKELFDQFQKNLKTVFHIK